MESEDLGAPIYGRVSGDERVMLRHAVMRGNDSAHAPFYITHRPRLIAY